MHVLNSNVTSIDWDNENSYREAPYSPQAKYRTHAMEEEGITNAVYINTKVRLAAILSKGPNGPEFGAAKAALKWRTSRSKKLHYWYYVFHYLSSFHCIIKSSTCSSSDIYCGNPEISSIFRISCIIAVSSDIFLKYNLHISIIFPGLFSKSKSWWWIPIRKLERYLKNKFCLCTSRLRLHSAAQSTNDDEVAVKPSDIFFSKSDIVVIITNEDVDFELFFWTYRIGQPDTWRIWGKLRICSEVLLRIGTSIRDTRRLELKSFLTLRYWLLYWILWHRTLVLHRRLL